MYVHTPVLLEPVLALLEPSEAGQLLIDATVGEGGHAEAFLSRKRYASLACLILDMNMPGMKGIELQQQLLDRCYELPVVFLTAHGDIPITVKAMRQGAINFLTKPVDEEALLASVREAFATHRDRLARSRKKAEILQAVEQLTTREREQLVEDRASRQQRDNQYRTLFVV